MRLLAREFGLPLISVYDHLLGVVADDRVNVSDVSDGMHPSPCGEELTARGISRGMRKITTSGCAREGRALRMPLTPERHMGEIFGIKT